jgi:hypothetical protein
MDIAAVHLFQSFATWTDKILSQQIPAEVVAFSFNLYEGTLTFDVQITGAPSFDAADQDWACDVIFSSGEDLFSIPRALVGNRWEVAFELVRGWSENYLKSGSMASILRASDGVGVGFVDGDIELIWPVAAA